MRGALSWPVVVCCSCGEVDTGCLLQLLARLHVFIIGHSGQTMAWSLIMGDNVPPHMQLGIDKSENPQWKHICSIQWFLVLGTKTMPPLFLK